MLDISQKPLSGLTFIDLFAGIGGFRLALESLGANCVFSSEWDKDAQAVYAANFGEIPHGDITQVDENSIPDHDILCGGFPCQAFSISGNQKGFEDSRGTLFFDIARIVKAKKPKILLLENVKNFEKHDNGRTLDVVRKTITDLGYTFDAKVLSAADYGVPQKRERIFMVSFRKDLGLSSFDFPNKIELDKNLSDLLLQDDAETEKLVFSRSDLFLEETNSVRKNKLPHNSIRIGQVNKGGQGERIYSPEGVAITLSAYGGGVFSKTGGYLINGKVRKLHPRECARVMGFPDSFKIADSHSAAYKQFGNSVVVDVVQHVLLSISNHLQS